MEVDALDEHSILSGLIEVDGALIAQKETDMSESTAIQWTDSTWNPLRARNITTGKVGWFCEHMSRGCDGCYAEGMNVNTYFGNGLPYKASSLKDLELFLDEKMLLKPLRWKAPRKIFPCSMTDVFGRFVDEAWIAEIFGVMAVAGAVGAFHGRGDGKRPCGTYRATKESNTVRMYWPNSGHGPHTFQILTKRPDRMLALMSSTAFRKKVASAAHRHALNRVCAGGLSDGIESDLWPLPNVWLGVSVEDQKTADERIPLLLETPAAVRWISAEPLLGPVDLTKYLYTRYHMGGERHMYNQINWVVVGGESGPKARPTNVKWVRDVVAQCKWAGVPVFVKQLGAAPFQSVKVSAIGEPLHEEDWPMRLKSKKGGDIDEWPEDLRVREMPDAA